VVGVPLEDVLENLRAGGVEVLYSSDLVKPWMRVERAPRAVEPRAFLAEILAPHGITVNAVAPGTTATAQPGLDEDGFREAAENAKDGCPVSQALKNNVELSVTARVA